jgi:serine/threonine-protein kinase
MQGVLCPSCGVTVPTTESECPQCGTSLFGSGERTQLRSRYDEPDSEHRTLDAISDDNLPFVPEKRTAPHPALTSRRVTPAALPAIDSTLPHRSGPGNGYASPEGEDRTSESMRETLVPPLPGPPPSPPKPPASSPGRRVRSSAPTERAVALRLEPPPPQVPHKAEPIPDDTQPGDRMGPHARKDPLIGTRLGEYVVEERVGIGGMGIVYRAMQPLIGNSVAIKVLRPDVIADGNDLQRFLGEARTVNSIRHRSIISIFGASDTPDGRKYLVMEYLEGESLEARLQREGRLPTADALPILEDVLSALAAAHAANVVHRDLKPANVFLVHQSDGRPWVKLLDFGLARGANRQDVSRIAGTPDYISPEHARGRPVSPASDLYAFGVLAFHLLTGKLPFPGNTPMEVMEQHVHKPPPVPHEVDDSIPLAMSHLILRLLDKDPHNRPDAKTVKADLKAAAKELRSAQTQVGPRPSAPRNAAARSAGTPPVALAPEAKIDPRLERRALEADRARAGWLATNWPWLAGGMALTWLMTVALYLLAQRPPDPDTRLRPIDPPGELLIKPSESENGPPDTTGTLDPDSPKAEAVPAKGPTSPLKGEGLERPLEKKPPKRTPRTR